MGHSAVGWIGPDAWLALTITLALAPVSFVLLMGPDRGKGGLISMSDFKIACDLIVATLFASVVLRVLIVDLGWMRRPALAERASGRY